MLAYRYPSCLTLKHLPSDFLTNSFPYWNRWLAALPIPINWSDEHELFLATAKGLNNTELAERLQWSRNSVRLWRERWQASAPSLCVAEAECVGELHLRQRITEVLSDEPRSGTPVRFSLEQVVEIVALACV